MGRLSVYFTGIAGDIREEELRETARQHGGKSVGTPTDTTNSERMMEFEVPDTRLEEFKTAVTSKGYRLQAMPEEAQSAAETSSMTEEVEETGDVDDKEGAEEGAEEDAAEEDDE